jgi:ATP-dependent helicase/DNAse subunit B
MNPDHSEHLKVANRMKEAVRRLESMATSVGVARQIREFNSDMRKTALSVEVVKSLKAGESATAAEHIARASTVYQNKMADLAKQYADCETVLAQWNTEQMAFEAARSLLSFSRESLRNLGG